MNVKVGIMVGVDVGVRVTVASMVEVAESVMLGGEVDCTTGRFDVHAAKNMSKPQKKKINGFIMRQPGN